MDIQLKSFGQATLAMAMAAGLAACSSTGENSPAAPTFRQTTETAPASLQLACASEAALRLNLDSDAVFPVASMRTPEGPFRVELTTGSGQAACLIDESGQVISVEEV